MKNNKGFTLIELLAVLVIIGIIITIIASRGFTAFNNAKKSISEINKKVILDSANIVMEDIKACDDSMDNSTIFSKDLYKDISRDFSNCKDLITSAKVGLNLSIEGMKKQNYLSINDLEDASKYTDEYVNVKGILKENPDTKEYTFNIEYNFNDQVLDKDTLSYKVIYQAMNDGNTKLELAKDKISSLKKNESYLGITEDDMGKSYYYRGNVKDNYVNFNNMCFRIFRIEGDGSIKLVLEDSTSPCNIDTNNNNSHIDSSSSFDGKLTSLNNWFKSNFKDKNILNKIKKDTWCIEDETKKNNEYYTSKEIEADYLIEQFNTSEISLPNMETLNFFFDSYNRNLESSYSEPNLKCSNSFDSQIGTLTADELVLAGGNKLEKASGYLDTNYYWWTLTAYQRYNDIDYIYVYKDGKDKNFFKVGSSNTRYKNNEIYLRPVITILNGVELEKNNADGTKEKPYVIRL